MWDFAVDPERRWRLPEQVEWQRTIRVPFSPETPASTVGETGFFQTCWYRRRFDPPRLAPDERLVLHFGAVDYVATVWIDGQLAVSHEGGFTPFEADITELFEEGRPAEVVVRADDDPTELAKPRGKQDWLVEPHAIWYPRTSGIWQTVWIERVPGTSIGSVRWTPNLERWEVSCEARVDGIAREGLTLRVKLHVGDLVLADDVYGIVGGEATRRIVFSDPGIDDHRNELLWSPRSPTIIQAELELRTSDGAVIDRVWSYTALRCFAVQAGQLVLNGRPYPLRLVLDQGYWPETGLTAPDDDALRRDVELAKAMGFNGVRKHQKIEDPRYLYWADHLGLLVWEEMPSAYRFTTLAAKRLTREWIEAIERDASHPCIVAWVPFNESWGVPNLPDIPAQRHFVQALYHLTKTLDPTRPVVGNDGWESVATDIIGIHDYDEEPERLRERYVGDEIISHLFKRERPGGRLLTVDGHEPAGQPIVLSEFGGIALAPDGGPSWGHSRAADPAAFAARYRALLGVVRKLTLFSGFCYTQFADTYQETNGLLYADRTPKFSLPEIAEATRGAETARETETQAERHQRMERFRKTHRVPPP